MYSILKSYRSLLSGSLTSGVMSVPSRRFHSLFGCASLDHCFPLVGCALGPRLCPPKSFLLLPTRVLCFQLSIFFSLLPLESWGSRKLFCLFMVCFKSSHSCLSSLILLRDYGCFMSFVKVPAFIFLFSASCFIGAWEELPLSTSETSLSLLLYRKHATLPSASFTFVCLVVKDWQEWSFLFVRERLEIAVEGFWECLL